MGKKGQKALQGRMTKGVPSKKGRWSRRENVASPTV